MTTPHRMNVGELHGLLREIDDAAEIEIHSRRSVTAVWADGSRHGLTWRDGAGWTYDNDNASYEAGYAYAAGYPD